MLDMGALTSWCFPVFFEMSGPWIIILLSCLTQVLRKRRQHTRSPGRPRVPAAPGSPRPPLFPSSPEGPWSPWIPEGPWRRKQRREVVYTWAPPCCVTYSIHHFVGNSTYRLSLWTRLSLRARGTNVSLLAETHTLYLWCHVNLVLYDARDQYLLILKFHLSSHQQHVKLVSTHIVTLGTWGTNTSLGSSRATSSWETRGTRNTSGTLWNAAVGVSSFQLQDLRIQVSLMDQSVWYLQ